MFVETEWFLLFPEEPTRNEGRTKKAFDGPKIKLNFCFDFGANNKFGLRKVCWRQLGKKECTFLRKNFLSMLHFQPSELWRSKIMKQERSTLSSF